MESASMALAADDEGSRWCFGSVQVKSKCAFQNGTGSILRGDDGRRKGRVAGRRCYLYRK